MPLILSTDGAAPKAYNVMSAIRPTPRPKTLVVVLAISDAASLILLTRKIPSALIIIGFQYESPFVLKKTIFVNPYVY